MIRLLFAAGISFSLSALLTQLLIDLLTRSQIGQPIREFVEKRLGLMLTIFCVLLIGGFVLIKFIA